MAEAGGTKIKAIAFDALTVFDARPVAALAEQLVPVRVIVAIEAFMVQYLVAQGVRQVGVEPGANLGAQSVVSGGIVQVHAQCLLS